MWHLWVYEVIPSGTELADNSKVIVEATSKEYEPLLRIYNLYDGLQPENGYYRVVIQTSQTVYSTIDDSRPQYLFSK